MSFINSVAKSMNGIKTIETSELIFTDDNSSLNTSAGITQAQTTGQNALNKSISATAFNTGTGVLTLTTQGTGVADLTQSLDGRYLSSTAGLVTTTGNQSISGVKTLTDFPAKSGSNTDLNPSSDNQFATKKYVDDNTITTAQANAITTNTAKVGITTGSQSISGIKTFASFPAKSGSGNDLNPSSEGEFATKKYVDDNTITTAQANAIQNAFINATISGQNITFTQEDGTTITIIIPTTSITIGKFFSSQYSKSSGSATLFGVSAGNPSDTNFDQFNGLITANGTTSKLEVEGINGNADKVHLQFSVAGEWNSTPYNKGIAIGVYRKYGVGGTYTQLKILRGLIVGNRARFVKNFTTAHPQDAGNTSTTMESCDGMYIYEDQTLISGYFYKFQLILVNSSDNTNHEFQINQVQNSATNLSQETAISCFTAQEHYN